MYFQYGEKEMNYLKERDNILGNVIDKLGFIKREIEPDLFSSVINKIVGQQISNKAQATVWKRFNDAVGKITPENVYKSDLSKVGLSAKKIMWIKSFSEKVISGEFGLSSLYDMEDKDAIKKLSTLDGVGVWTAEMVLMFSMERMNILSFGDFGIKNGMKLLYNKAEITKADFEKYRKIYSPYCSVASMYLWAISNSNGLLIL